MMEYDYICKLATDERLLRLTVYRTVVNALGVITFLIVAIPFIASWFDSGTISAALIAAIFVGLALFASDRLRDIGKKLTRLIAFEQYSTEALAQIQTLKEAGDVGQGKG